MTPTDDLERRLRLLVDLCGSPLEEAEPVCLICDEAADEIARLRAENERLEFALAYLGSCTAATAEGLVDRKSTSKSELSRHRSICEKFLAACRGESLERGLSSSFIAGTEHRLQKAIEAIDARQALQEGSRHE